MTKLNLTGLLLIFSFQAFGQEMSYFNMYFLVKSSEPTPRQRKYQIADNQILTFDYVEGVLELSSVVNGTNDKEEVDDLISYIRFGGQESKYKDSFKNLKGNFKFYYKNQNQSTDLIFKQSKIYYAQVWSEDANEQLISGTGINKSPSEEYDEDIYSEYKDSVLIKLYTIRRMEKDTIYGKFDRQAEPKEGMQAFRQNLVSVLKYPVVARFVGKEGRVYIQFIVDETGKLTDFSPKTKEGYRFESKVVKKLENFPSWTPALYKGRYVKTRYVLSVVYKLTD